MFWQYIYYRIISIFYGPIQLIKHYLKSTNNDMRLDNLTPYIFQDVADSAMSISYMVIFEIVILTIIFTIALLFCLCSKKTHKNLLVRTSEKFAQAISWLGAIAIISLIFYIVDEKVYPYYDYSFVYPYKYSALTLNFFRYLGWIIVGAVIPKYTCYILQTKSEKAVSNIKTESHELVNGGRKELTVANSMDNSNLRENNQCNMADVSRSSCSTERLFCRKCGVELPMDSAFCIKCGTKVQIF